MKRCTFLSSSNFDFLLDKNFDVIFIDIEGTVLAPNMCCEMIVDSGFYSLFLLSIEKNNVIDHRLSDIIYVGKNFKRSLMDNKIPDIFNKLQCMGTKLFALSSGFNSSKKIEQIKYLGVNFDNLFFTKRGSKGVFLKKTLTDDKDHWENITGKDISSIKFAVIDNHSYKLQNIQDCLDDEFDVSLILYTNENFPIVKVQDFKHYWNDVIISMNRFKSNKDNKSINNKNIK